MKHLSQKIGYKHYFTTPYHAQSNSVERVNSTLVGMLSMYASSSQLDWDEQLSACTFAVNTLHNRSIHTSPYYLMFHREPLLPGDIPSRISSRSEESLANCLPFGREKNKTCPTV